MGLCPTTRCDGASIAMEASQVACTAQQYVERAGHPFCVAHSTLEPAPCPDPQQVYQRLLEDCIADFNITVNGRISRRERSPLSTFHPFCCGYSFLAASLY